MPDAERHFQAAARTMGFLLEPRSSVLCPLLCDSEKGFGAHEVVTSPGPGPIPHQPLLHDHLYEMHPLKSMTRLPLL